MTGRIRELDREWGVERVLEANAASLGITGLALGVFRNRRWLILPGLLQHARGGARRSKSSGDWDSVRERRSTGRNTS